MDASEVRGFIFEKHLILDIQTTFTQQKPLAKTFDGITIKMKAAGAI